MTGYGNANDPRFAQRVMRALDLAAAQLEAAKRAATEPIAVVGVGCRFPGGADGPDAFWRRLADGFDGVCEVPPDRWDVERFYDPDPDAAGKIYTRRGGFLERIDGLDARFFEIAPREAASMDPQQRMALEVCWEALEDAGLVAERLHGSRVGVYVGVTTNEYGNLLARAAGCEKIDAWFGTGNALNSIAGRISHTFGLQGPAMAIDTACSSSLVAVHLACQSLRTGECELALAGGVNLILSPEVMIAICRAKMLAPDGRCKTFDAAADGYARGEGCGVVVLKRLSDALKCRDNVLAVLRGSAVNQDGPSSGFTVPNGQAQQSLIRQALAAAQVAPAEIDYLEVHGTGTSLGDPIEVQAAAAVFGEERPTDRPLILGSVKTNIGHLESAAGIAGLIKTILAVAHGQIPPHLHYQTPNPHIPWQDLPVAVATRLTDWPETERPRRAGLSSFGASGTNAHVVIEQAPAAAQPSPGAGGERSLHVLTLSAKTPQALSDLAERYAQRLTDGAIPFADICFSANTGRSHFVHRLAVVAATAEEARNRLRQFARGTPSPYVLHGAAPSEPTLGGPVREPDASGRREGESWEAWLHRLGELYVGGADIDWQTLDPDDARRRVSLPTYPWQRQRYWFQSSGISRETAPAEAVDDTATLRAVRQGDIGSLADRLALGETFSDEEKSLLPKLLQAVARQHRNEQAAATTDQWLYQIHWRRQLRDGRQPPPDFFPAPREICGQLRAEAARLTSSDDFRQFWRAVVATEQLSLQYVAAGMSQLGLDRQVMPGSSTAELMANLQVDQRHQRLFEHLLAMLAASHATDDNGPETSVAAGALNGSPGEACRALLARHPAARAELTLLDRCGSQLADVLRGRCDPLQLLFPEDGQDTAAQLYEDSPGARVMNALVQRTVAAAVADLPADRKLRVLEIGAGTGGTTSSILAALPADRCDYVFTDISPGFTTAARTKFQAYPFIQYRSLDIERPPESQGLAHGQFDVVVAANVLHATRDLGESARHARQLLAPGGLLVLLESTQPMRFVDLIFGMTEGWWRFADHLRRPLHPLLAARDWEQLLLESGFREAAALGAAEDEDGILAKQSIVIARATEEEPPGSDPRPVQHWTILADRAGVGRRLASLARARGDTVTEVYAAERFEQTGPDEFSIAPDQMVDLRRVMPTAALGGSRQRVVHLWSLDAAQTDLAGAAALGCQSVLNLSQCLTDGQCTQPARLCLVTQQAAAVQPDDKLDGLAQSPLWGMARVIAAEHPELAPRRVDLDLGEPDESARLLFEELQSDDEEDEIAFRAGCRFVPRLVRAEAGLFGPDAAHVQVPPGGAPGEPRVERGAPASCRPLPHQTFRGDAGYLITGGLGGLGLLIARSMVQQGARHLILVGRRPPSDSAAIQLRDLERMGARVAVCQADVSRRNEVAQVLSQVAETSPPLAGVIHAAGIVDDGILRQLSWQRFAGVMAPKVEGAWHLHQLTADMPLDFFLLFSSATSLLGSPGQSNHAAANAFLDALASYRRARGLRALSINWGAWSEVGAAAGHDVSQRVKLKGIGTISPELGLAVLDRLWSAPVAQVAVVPVDWSQQTGVPPLFAELITADAARPADRQEDAAGLRQRVLDQPPHRRRALLIDHVRQSVAGVLGLDAAEISPVDGFMELGMDSLTSIELRNRLQNQLQMTLPSTVAFDHPNAQRLADFLLDQLVGGRAQPGREVAPAEDPDDLEDLSEDELGTLIDEELKAAIE